MRRLDANVIDVGGRMDALDLGVGDGTRDVADQVLERFAFKLPLDGDDSSRLLGVVLRSEMVAIARVAQEKCPHAPLSA